MNYKIKDNVVAVSTEVFWLPIDESTPRNVRVLAIAKDRCGIAQITEISAKNIWFSHWHPLPTFRKD